MNAKSKLCGAFAALLLGATVVTGVPRVAWAVTSDELKVQLEEAKTKRDDLYSQAEQLSEELNETIYQIEVTQGKIDDVNGRIDDTKAEIETKKQELADAQTTLSKRIVADYKSGGVSFLSIIFSADSFDDFVSRVYYADKISESDAKCIQKVKDLRAELETQQALLEQQKSELEQVKAEQQSLKATQESQKAEMDAKAAEADEYVSNLDQQVKEALAAEEEAARKAAEEAARKAAEEAAKSQTGYVTNSSSSSSSSSSGSSSSGSSNLSTSGSLTTAQRNTIVSAAMSMVGGNYVLGACDPSTATFDCSGLTSWAYAQAGLYLPHSSSSQRAMCTLKSIGSLTAGDLVFWNGHVAIYAGGGMIIEAQSPSTGVVYGSIWGSPLGGGTPY